MLRCTLRVRKSAGSVWGWAPISIYTAWVTVATLANLAILITRALDGGIPVLNDLSAIALTAGVLVLGYLMKERFGDVAFPLVFLWALVGVGAHVAQVSWLTAAVVYLLCAIGAVATFVPLARLRGAFARLGRRPARADAPVRAAAASAALGCPPCARGRLQPLRRR